MQRVIVSLSLLAALAIASSAQWRGTRVDPESDPKAFDITTRADLEDSMRRVAALRVQLAAARDDRERGVIRDSILRLCQDELNKQGNASGAVAVEKSPDPLMRGVAIRWTGAWRMVEDTIRELGPDGLALYEKTYGPRADSLVQEAAAAHDMEALNTLNRRFGLTRAGLRASALLAATWWERGEASRAARALERALFAPELVQPPERAALTAWLSHCYRDLGERANLSRLASLPAELRDLMVDEGGEKASLDAIIRRNLAGARDNAADTLTSLGIEWPGGNYTNTGVPPAPGNWAPTAWARALPRHAAESHPFKFMGYPSPMATPYMPVSDGNMAYINTGERLVAYDLIGAGAGDGPAWACKPFPTFSRAHDGGSERISWRTAEPDPALILPVSVSRGTVFAALENPLDSHIHERNSDGMFGLYSHYPQMRRALCAADAATGRLLWKIGGLYEGSVEDTTSFLYGVVHDGTLYAIGSRMPQFSEIWLYALNPDTGEVRWNLRVCYGQQETTMFGRPARTPYPSLCAISGGTMYLCTNIGGVVAVDLARRCLNWISRYEYVPRPITKYTETYYREPTWANNPTYYCEADGQALVIVAPADANMLFCMDARDGQIKWRTDREALLAGGRYLCGVRQDVAWVAGDGGFGGAGSTRLVGVNVRNGREAHSVRPSMAGGGMLALAGRPCIAGGRLFWPGYNGGGCSICAIDLDAARVVMDARAPAGYAGVGYSTYSQHGLLMTVSGADYSAGNSQFSLRCDMNELLETARRQAAADPGNPDGLLRLGMLQLRMGSQRAEALKTLRQAFEDAAGPPVNARVREQAARALVGAHLERADALHAQRKFAEAHEQIKLAQAFALLRSQRSDCFVRLERTLQAQGDAAGLRALYEDLLESDPDFGVGEDPEIPARMYGLIRLAAMIETENPARAAGLYQLIQEGPERLTWQRTRLRAFGLAGLKGLVRAAGREVYKPQDDAAQALLQSKDPGALLEILQRYPLSLAADDAALRLAADALKRRDPAQATRQLLAALEDNTQRPRRAEMQAWLALAHEAAGEKLRARLLSARTLREFPGGSITREGKTIAFKDVLGPLAGAAANLGAGAALPSLPAQMQQLWKRTWPERSFTRIPTMPATSAIPRVFLAETTQEGLQTLCLDAPSGEVIWRGDQSLFVSGVHETEQGVVMETQLGLTAFDDQGNERWTAGAGGPPHPVSMQAGMLVFGSRYRNPGTNRLMVRVTALDAASGGEIWNAEFEASAVRWIGQVASGVLVLLTGNEQWLHLLDAETGAVTKTVTLELSGQVAAADPAIDGGVVWLVDVFGGIRGYGVDDLAVAGAFNTAKRGASLLHAGDGRVAVMGSEGIACVEISTGRTVFARNHERTDVFQGAKYSSGVFYLFLRDPAGGVHVHGLSTKDGAPLFRHAVKAENTDRPQLTASAAFNGGVATVYAVLSIVEGGLRLTSFRLLILNADGTERLNWSQPLDGATSSVAQLGIIDQHLVLACGNATHCFGLRE